MSNYNIKTFDFKEVQSPEDFHRKISRLLQFPSFYGKNWDALWDAITGLVEMPTHLIFYDHQCFTEKFKGDGDTFFRLYWRFKKEFPTLCELETDFTNKLQTNKIESIFEEEPFQYGLRGDPFLWKELKESFTKIEMPENEDALIREIHQQIILLTGKSTAEKQNYYVEKYSKGGMSGGFVCGEFWVNSGIPLLIGRYRKITG